MDDRPSRVRRGPGGARASPRFAPHATLRALRSSAVRGGGRSPGAAAVSDFDAFLAEALPPLGLSPAAHRRRNIRRRVTRRMEGQGSHEFPLYLSRIREDPVEREAFRALLTVTISRFWRNRAVFDALVREVFPRLAAGGAPVRAWCAGCASGEEPYSVRIAWEVASGGSGSFAVLATDIDGPSLARARAGLYGAGSLREMPVSLREAWFDREGEGFRLQGQVIRSVEFRRHDLLREPPPGRFDLIMCRNMAFTYFGAPEREAAARALADALVPDGWLVIGRTERLPPDASALFAPAFPGEKIFRRR